MLNMKKKTLNPELEAIRDKALKDEEKRQKCIEEEAEKFIETLSRIHAIFLFHSDYGDTLRNLCIALDSTPSDIQFNSWNALAGGLGLSYLQVECIKKFTCDFTFTVLKSYAVKVNSDLGTLVRVLKNIQRLDAFGIIQKDFAALATKREASLNDDSAFSLTGNEPSARLVCPHGFAKIRSLLESTLPTTVKPLKKERLSEIPAEGVKESDTSRNLSKEENRFQGASVIPPPKVAKYNVLLTFADDGAELAKRIKSTFRSKQGRRPQIGVLVLDDHVEKVIQNPEKFIMHRFYQMNYVIPILTEGYMKAIAQKDEDNTSNSLDSKYVQYIHDLCTKYYSANSCRNNKIRCILPSHNSRAILNHTHMKLDPIMRAYEYDNNIEQLARRITKTVDEDN